VVLGGLLGNSRHYNLHVSTYQKCSGKDLLTTGSLTHWHTLVLPVLTHYTHKTEPTNNKSNYVIQVIMMMWRNTRCLWLDMKESHVLFSVNMTMVMWDEHNGEFCLVW